MNIINAGYTVNVSLVINQPVNVQGRGAVVTAVSGLGVSGTLATLGDSVLTFGPYNAAVVLSIAAVGADCSFGVNTALDVPSHAQYHSAMSVAGGDFNLLPYATKLKLGRGAVGGATSGNTFKTFPSGASGYTFQLQTVVEAAYDSVQIGVFNSDTSTVAGVMFSLLAPSLLQADSSTASNYNSATWTNGTWGGAATGTLDAGTSANVPSVTWSDIVPLASVVRADSGKILPILQIRLSYPITVTGTYITGPGATGAGWESDNTATLSRPWRVRSQAVIAASNATRAALTSATMETAFWPPFIIRYYTTNGAVRQFIVPGDSISEGFAATVQGVGWVNYLQNSISTLTTPVEVCNLGIGGATSLQIYTTASVVSPHVPGATMIDPNGTPNDMSTTIVAADIVSSRLMKSKLRLLALANRMKTIMWTMLPVTTAFKAWNASDSLRVAMNTADVASTNYKVLDFSTAMSGTTVAGQVQLINGADGVHPNDAGYQVMASVGQAQVTL